MGKTSSVSKPSGKEAHTAPVGKQSKVSKPEVQVFKCPSAFPISSKSTKGMKRPLDSDKSDQTDRGEKATNKSSQLLDLHEVAKEIRAYGATAFGGKQKRDYHDEQYFKLTGRHKKKQQTPLPILRGIKKASAHREAKAREEARQAGIILPKAKKETAKRNSTYDNFGPAPNIGFMKEGIFRVKNTKKKR